MTRVAIVTGGASGIGAALVRALTGRGATVVVADIDEAGAAASAERAAMAGRGPAAAAAVDVTDPAAVADLVSRTVAEHGRIDFMFNNAGIAVGGLAEELTLQHWDRVIDVNLRGVVHGVQAVYPVLLRQGRGHIVNTASLAGLIGVPMLAPYSATKHAVVGLSLALRAEAAARGVRVSVACPGFVDTPMLDNANPGLPPTAAAADGRAAARMAGRLYDPDLLAADVLRGVARNQAVIVAPASARITWRVVRYAPWLNRRVLSVAARRSPGQPRGQAGG
jgi:NAD(P)-dependent dehydrogenase (short-subunit alcohol dehydrogenase family)